MLAEAKRGEISSLVGAVLRPNGSMASVWSVPLGRQVAALGGLSLVTRAYQDMMLGREK